MDIILCHTTADFDALGAAVGLTRLLPGSKIVLTGGAHPAVKDFLALHRDEYPFIERRSVNPAHIRSLIVVDTQQRDRLGKAAEWFDLAHLQSITVYDHHLGQASDIPATQISIEPVGASTTIIVEQLQRANINLTTAEATVMALGIHVDTGSLRFEMSTARDALALGWLMAQGANLAAINEYIEPGLSPQLQQLFQIALEQIEYLSVRGQTIGWLTLKTAKFVPGLSSLAAQLRSIAEIDVLLLAHEFPVGVAEIKLTIIGRSQIPSVNLDRLFQPLGGGGHAQAAAVNLRGVDSASILAALIQQIKVAIPHPLTARDLMSTPIRTIRPETTIAQAQRVLLRYGHSGLPVVDETDKLVGIISRRDLDLAFHHGFSHAPVKGYMTTNVQQITLDTTLPQIEALMVTHDLGRLPVLANGELVGIITRTDVLRELHQERGLDEHRGDGVAATGAASNFNLRQLQDKLAPQLWELLITAAQAAEQRGWHLYLVGGAVRDLLIAATATGNLLIKDIDLVVDGFHQAADVGAGVEIAKVLQQLYPAARLDIHGAFQTAALLWHQDPIFDSLWVDIATARTEFYPYPAANPEVEASSIRQDLYRRDFTINALALRLTTDRSHPELQSAPLLDFFGGLRDLQAKQIRVLHPNSFIEDPTRIYRGVRFAVRLGFAIEPQTVAYIRYAINSGVYDRTVQTNHKTPALQTRLKTELKHLLQAEYWQPTLELLADLGALQCIHPTLTLDRVLLRQLQLLARCLHKFDAQQSIGHWQLRLEAIIAHLAPEYRDRVAKNLQLSVDSIDRLNKLVQVESDLWVLLPTLERVSQIAQVLRQHDRLLLILIAVRSSCGADTALIIRRQIWKFLTIWSNIQPILTGDDLQRLGYKPGPQYRQILDAILASTLDGVVTDKSSAEKFLLNY
jgi:tRNA nucleotidyltransferase (CCA-adding enzyme)